MNDELAATIITNVFSLGVGLLLGWRGFLLQERFKEKQKKRDALRSLLGNEINMIGRFIAGSYLNVNFDMSTKALAKLDHSINNVQAAAPSFLTDKNIANKIDAILKLARMAFDNRITKKEQFESFLACKSDLENALISLEKEILGKNVFKLF